jgi:hypothetical protein
VADLYDPSFCCHKFNKDTTKEDLFSTSTSKTATMNVDLTVNIVNREAYRRSLQNSLYDVLGDVSEMQMPVRNLNLPSASSPVLASAQVNAFMQQRSLAIHSNQSKGLLAQSLGMQSLLPSTSAIQHEILLSQAEKQIAQMRATSILRQSLQHAHHKQAAQDAYLLNFLRNHASKSVPVPYAQSLMQDPQRAQKELKAKQRKQILYTLNALGNNLRSRHEPFIDCINIEDPLEASRKTEAARRSRGGVAEHFPERVHRFLADVEKEGLSDICSFYSHGRAFGIHDVERFVNEVMPKYFKQSKWNSFARQLNLYGFTRMASGPDAGAYYHELFLKGRPSLCLHMRRVGTPKGNIDRRKCRPKNVSEIKEPDFYQMKPSL